MSFNRIHNSSNPNQGEFKKVLCVCSAGLLRSPTAAYVLSTDPYNYNTRSCGAVSSYALVCLDEVLLSWADEVVCMEQEHVDAVEELYSKFSYLKKKPTICLNIQDSYAYRDDKLQWLIKEKYDAASKK